MYKDLIEDKLYQTMDQSNERKITPLMFYWLTLNKMVETIGRVRYCLLMLIKLKSLLIGQKLKTKNIKLIFIVLNAQSLQKNSNRWKK